MIELTKCCEREPEYDTDSCGTEWLTCPVCKFEVETYSGGEMGANTIDEEWCDRLAGHTT